MNLQNRFRKMEKSYLFRKLKEYYKTEASINDKETLKYVLGLVNEVDCNKRHFLEELTKVTSMLILSLRIEHSCKSNDKQETILEAVGDSMYSVPPPTAEALKMYL